MSRDLGRNPGFKYKPERLALFPYTMDVQQNQKSRLKRNKAYKRGGKQTEMNPKKWTLKEGLQGASNVEEDQNQPSTFYSSIEQQQETLDDTIVDAKEYTDKSTNTPEIFCSIPQKDETHRTKWKRKTKKSKSKKRILKEDLSERLKVEQDPTQPNTSNSSAEQRPSEENDYEAADRFTGTLQEDTKKPISKNMILKEDLSERLKVEQDPTQPSTSNSSAEQRPSEENDYEAADRFTGTLQEDFDYKTQGQQDTIYQENEDTDRSTNTNLATADAKTEQESKQKINKDKMTSEGEKQVYRPRRISFPFAGIVLKMMCFFLLVCVILASGIVSRISLHIIMWHLQPPVESSPDFSRLGGLLVRKNSYNSTCGSVTGKFDDKWSWALLLTVITPHVLTCLSAVFRLMFKTNEPLSPCVTVPIIFIEVLHSVGVIMMSFWVLPSFDPVTASVVYLGIIIVPEWIHLRNSICGSDKCESDTKDDKSTSNRWGKKSNIIQKKKIQGRKLEKTVTIVGTLSNITGSVLIAYNIKSNSGLISMYIIGSLLASIRYWENFIDMGDKDSRYLEWLKYELHVARTKNSLLTSGIKVSVPVVIVCIYNSSFGKDIYGNTDPCVGNTPFVVSAVNMACSYICYKASKTLCVINCQRGFSLSMIIIPTMTTFLLTGILTRPTFLNFIHSEQSDLFFNEWSIRDIPKLDDICLRLMISFILLNVSVFIITFYVWKTNGYKNGETRRIFIVPFYCGVFTELSMLLNRRRHDKEYRVVRGKVNGQQQDGWNNENVNNVHKPMIYACATLWHETETEMKRLMESIFRLDRKRFENDCRHKINYEQNRNNRTDLGNKGSSSNKAESQTCSKKQKRSGQGKGNKVGSLNTSNEPNSQTKRQHATGQEGVKWIQLNRSFDKETYEDDVFELETHLFFDNAFNDNNSLLEVNKYVKRLIKVTKDVGSIVYNDRVKLKQSEMMQTAYGARIVWTLPGETKLVAHLKDKNKVKQHKRWSQIMYMHYISKWKLQEQIWKLHDEEQQSITYYFDKIRLLLEENESIKEFKTTADGRRHNDIADSASNYQSQYAIDAKYEIDKLRLEYIEKRSQIGETDKQRRQLIEKGFSLKRLDLDQDREIKLIKLETENKSMPYKDHIKVIEETNKIKESKEIFTKKKEQIGTDIEIKQALDCVRDVIEVDEKLKDENVKNLQLKDIEEKEKELKKIITEKYTMQRTKKEGRADQSEDIEKRVSNDDILQISEHTYILTLDGDIEFKPEAVLFLLRRMKKSPIVGSACGRIHPEGRGVMVWYQKFEYAISHWLQKATEHVIGCVLCGPGCFSLFRGSAILHPNVLETYSKEATEAHEVLQYDKGEDRWLCTLLLKQGWRIEYCAEADARTCVPEGFYEFYKQRRRWVPSTLANCYEIISNWKDITKNNENISFLYIAYQTFLMISTLLTPGMTFMLIVEALIIGFSIIPSWVILTLNTVPVVIFALMTIWSTKERQLQFAAIFSCIYVLVMLIAAIGIINDAVREGICSVTTIVVIFEIGVILTAGLTHPMEVLCLIPGALYFVAIPAMSMLMFLYSIANLHETSWGTREDVGRKQYDSKNKERGYLFSFGNFFSCICCPDKVNGRRDVMKERKGKNRDIEEGRDDTAVESGKDQTQIKTPFSSSNDNIECSLASIEETEELFWKKVVLEYLKPVDIEKSAKPTEKNNDGNIPLKKQLLSLRNSASLLVFLLNAGLVTILFALTQNSSFKENLTIVISDSDETCNLEIDPIAFMFIVIFGILLLIQFLSMLYHRGTTMIRILAYTTIFRSEELKQKYVMDMAMRDILSTDDFISDEDIEERSDKKHKILNTKRKWKLKVREQCENLKDLREKNLNQLQIIGNKSDKVGQLVKTAVNAFNKKNNPVNTSRWDNILPKIKELRFKQ